MRRRGWEWLCSHARDPFFINLRSFRRDPLTFLSRLARDRGDICFFSLGFVRFVLINHPDLVKDVLVTNQHKFVKGLGLQRAKRVLGDGLLTSEGDLHKRQRRLIQPAFHREAIRSYGEVIASGAVRASQRWPSGSSLDMAEEMRRMTLAIVAQALFHADIERDSPDVGEALTAALELFQLGTPLLVARLLYHLPLPSVRRMKLAQAKMDAIIYRLIHEHRAADGRRSDVLTMLLDARDVDYDGASMSDRQVRDEVLTLFLAGHETTTIVFTWAWYLLATHPAVEQHLHEELRRVLGDRLPTVDDLPALSYARAIIAESMRCYPPAWLISRMALEDCDVGGFVIPARTHVFISPYLLHRDTRYFRDPAMFIPERWMPGESVDPVAFTFLPFGAGPRNCIGEAFAWMEGILSLATIAQRWRFQLPPTHSVELEPRITLRPKHGMNMLVAPRTPPVA